MMSRAAVTPVGHRCVAIRSSAESTFSFQNCSKYSFENYRVPPLISLSTYSGSFSIDETVPVSLSCGLMPFEYF
jgi:hypothetical protein